MRRVHGSKLATIGVLLCQSVVAHAAPTATLRAPTDPPDAISLDTEGRPTIVLDYLEFPMQVEGAAMYKKQLKTILYREVRRVRWGAGTGSRITYRFFVTKLELRQTDDVLRVTCHAVGKLPKGKTAKSELTFSGPSSERNAVVKRVLEIVSRGVITRLAEMERIRRGDL